MRLSTRAGHTRPRLTNPPWHRPVAVVVSYALVVVGLATGGLAVTPVPADAAPNTTGPAPTVVFTDTLDHGSPTLRYGIVAAGSWAVASPRAAVPRCSTAAAR